MLSKVKNSVIFLGVVFQLLLYICGSKEAYRSVRDTFAIQTHYDDVRRLCSKLDATTAAAVPMTGVSATDALTADVTLPTAIVLPYDVLIQVVSACALLKQTYTAVIKLDKTF